MVERLRRYPAKASKAESVQQAKIRKTNSVIRRKARSDSEDEESSSDDSDSDNDNDSDDDDIDFDNIYGDDDEGYDMGRVIVGPGKGANSRMIERPVFKVFPERGSFYGSVTSFDTEEGLWLVTYEDEETEQYDDQELRAILVPPPPPPACPDGQEQQGRGQS